MLVAFGAAACGGDKGGTGASPSATVPASPASQSPAGGGGAIAGTWDGTWTSTTDPGLGGDVHLVFTQTGNQIGGEVDVTNTPCVSHGTVTGTLSGNDIQFGAVQAEQTVSYTGTLSGSKIAGTYAAPQCGNGAGTWEVTKAG